MDAAVEHTGMYLQGELRSKGGCPGVQGELRSKRGSRGGEGALGCSVSRKLAPAN